MSRILSCFGVSKVGLVDFLFLSLLSAIPPRASVPVNVPTRCLELRACPAVPNPMFGTPGQNHAIVCFLLLEIIEDEFLEGVPFRDWL